MKISMTDAGKRYNRDWIFRRFSYQFHQGQSYAITGHNGSGKSTLLQVIAGAVGLSEGSLSLEDGTTKAADDQQFRFISICAPYLELIEEMNATEFLLFHSCFKPFIEGYTVSGILETCGLGNTGLKQIRFFSSGMKQRLKLAHAVFTSAPVLLLDEPCTNLDRNGIDLYHHLLQTYCANKMIIVSSNDEEEYRFCREIISMKDYKF